MYNGKKTDSPKAACRKLYIMHRAADRLTEDEYTKLTAQLEEKQKELANGNNS